MFLIRKREFIERELYKYLALRLDGCCRETCPDDVSQTPCGKCIEMKDCKTNERGLFIELRYFQLLAVDVHSDVKSRYLRQVTEAAEEERANFELNEKVRKSSIYSKITDPGLTAKPAKTNNVYNSFA